MPPSVSCDICDMSSCVLYCSGDWARNVHFIFGVEVPPMFAAIDEKCRDIFAGILKYKNGLYNLFHAESDCCHKTRHIAFLVRTFLLLMGVAPMVFPNSTGLTNLHDYALLQRRIQERMVIRVAR